MTLDERFDRAEAIIKKPSFRENKGLGNEVGYYIFDYPAEQELLVRERIAYMKRKNEQSTDEYRIVEFDLYNIIIDILQQKGYLEKCFEFEKKRLRPHYESGWQYAPHYRKGQHDCKPHRKKHAGKINRVSHRYRQMLSDSQGAYGVEQSAPGHRPCAGRPVLSG